MKIVHINTALSWSGGEAQTYHLIKGLEDRAIANTLVAQPNSALAVRAKKEGITVVEVFMRGEWDIVAVLKLKRILKRIKPDVLHLHTSHAHTLGLLAGKLAKVEKIISTRRMDFPISGYFSRLKYNKVDKIVAISEIVKKILIKGGIKKERVSLIYDAVNCSTVTRKGALRKELDVVGPNSLLLGTVAALVKRKGHKYLFEAMVKVKKQFPQLKLLVVGEGPLEQKLRKLAEKLGLENEIIFLGFRKDIPEVLSTLDIFLLVSTKEGLGVSLLEAGSYGLPIVATNVGGIPEIVKDGVTGLLVPPKDSQTLAEKIIYLLTHRNEAQKMGENAKAWVEKNFSVDKIVNSYVSLYESLIEQE